MAKRYNEFALTQCNTTTGKDTKVLYGALTIGGIKRYIKKHNIPIDGGSEGHYVLCTSNGDKDNIHVINISVQEFMSRTGDGAMKDTKIMQQKFFSEVRALKDTVW